MKTQHTPGKWHADWSRHRDVNDSVRTENQNIVAWIESNDVGAEQAQANARLIAASPMLLQALEMAVATIERLAFTPAKLASVQGTIGFSNAAIKAATDGE